MPITIRDARPGAPPVQRNVASLVGGCIIALGCFTLMLLVASELTRLSWPVLLGSAVLSAGIGLWIRIADL